MQILSLAFVFALAGCATGPNANPADPLEPLNRGVYAFNEGVDTVVLKPVAQAYRDVTPYPVRAGVNNFFRNLQDLWSAVNAMFQLRPQAAVESLLRVGVNTTFGFGGVIDLASEMGIERHSEDLGKTLGRWGIHEGPYLVLPLLGPSSIRDATDVIVYQHYDPVSRIDDIPTRNSLTGLRIVNTRAQVLPLSKLLDEAAIDKYSFTRDAYLQKRRAEVDRLNGGAEGYKPSDADRP